MLDTLIKLQLWRYLCWRHKIYTMLANDVWNAITKRFVFWFIYDWCDAVGWIVRFLINTQNSWNGYISRCNVCIKAGKWINIMTLCLIHYQPNKNNLTIYHLISILIIIQGYSGFKCIGIYFNWACLFTFNYSCHFFKGIELH